MSIPHYQEPSLQGENIAKRRVMKKAKEAFEGEEQRALKSGQVIDELKASYKTIVQNLQLQLVTMNLTKSAIESIVAAASSGGPAFRMSTILATPNSDDDFGMSDDGSDFKAAQGNLHSLLIGSLGKLVNLSSQLKILCGGLSDKVKESGKPITGSADLSKINALFEDVNKTYGQESEYGFAKGVGQMLADLRLLGGRGVPQVDGLVVLYEASMIEAHQIIGRLQRNEYETNIESVLIPKNTRNPARQADIAAGTERRNFSGEEYKLLMELRNQGLLRGDDFTSVYSGYRDDDDSTIASSRSSSSLFSRSSRSSRSSRNPFGDFRYVPRMSRRGYEKEGDSETSSSDEDSGQSYYARESDSDDDTNYSGAGLYSIPASYRFPKRVF
jgi:hypothetical protein